MYNLNTLKKWLALVAAKGRLVLSFSLASTVTVASFSENIDRILLQMKKIPKKRRLCCVIGHTIWYGWSVNCNFIVSKTVKTHSGENTVLCLLYGFRNTALLLFIIKTENKLWFCKCLRGNDTSMSYKWHFMCWFTCLTYGVPLSSEYYCIFNSTMILVFLLTFSWNIPIVRQSRGLHVVYWPLLSRQIEPLIKT